MNRARLLLACTWLATVAGRASAAPDESEQRSRAHFQLGRAHLQLREYDEAIKEFEIGYRDKPLPLFLYNIAQVAYVAGKADKALDYYLQYLSVSPKAPERAEVQQRIDELQRRVADELERATPPPPQPVIAPESVVAATVVESAPPPRKKDHKTLIIALTTTGAVLVIGAVALGVALSGQSQSELHNWGTLVVTTR